MIRIKLKIFGLVLFSLLSFNAYAARPFYALDCVNPFGDQLSISIGKHINGRLAVKGQALGLPQGDYTIDLGSRYGRQVHPATMFPNPREEVIAIVFSTKTFFPGLPLGPVVFATRGEEFLFECTGD